MPTISQLPRSPMSLPRMRFRSVRTERPIRSASAPCWQARSLPSSASQARCSAASASVPEARSRSPSGRAALNDGTLIASAFDPPACRSTTLSPTDHAMLNNNGLADAVAGVVAARPVLGRQRTSASTPTAPLPPPAAAHSYSITSLAPVTTIASGDLVAISQGGPITPSATQPARRPDDRRGAASRAGTERDTLWVGTGRQHDAAPDLRRHLDLADREAADLQAAGRGDHRQHHPRWHDPQRRHPDLQPAGHADAGTPNMGSGFHCDVVNLSGGNVTFGAGIITSSGVRHAARWTSRRAARRHLFRRHCRVRIRRRRHAPGAHPQHPVR